LESEISKQVQEDSKEGSEPFSSFKELVEWVSLQREGILHAHLFYDVHLVEFSPPRLTFRLSSKAPKNLPHLLESLLNKKREEVWTIAISEEMGHPTLYEDEQKAIEEHRNTILTTPLVKLLVDAFPGTTLVQIEDMKEKDNVR